MVEERKSLPKEAFEKIDPDKRARILRIAAAEFARIGYHGASVSEVAQRAGIAKGAVYLYFESKQDLYLESLRDGAVMLEKLFRDVAAEGGTVREQMHRLYTRGVQLIDEEADRFRMYCDIFTGSDPELVHIAAEIEAASARFYRRLVEDGQRSGEVRADLPVPVLAYVLDTAFVQLFAAAVSGYQAERLRAFWPEVDDPVAAFRAHLDGLLAMMTRGLQPGSPVPQPALEGTP